MPTGITRFIRFVDSDGQIRYGEAPGHHRTSQDGKLFCSTEVLSGDPFDGSLASTGYKVEIEPGQWRAPIVPTNIFCIGLNYMRHYEESAKKRGIPLPDKPVVFMKPSSCLAHPEQEIWMPRIEHGEELDWEAELAIVIGKECRNVSKEEALDYVLGYTVGNDVSSRHWQKNAGGGQWIKGKSFDTFCPLGPVLSTREEIPDPQKLRITTRVNGATQQDSETADMIFTCAEIIEWLSNNMTLLPGTVILTGTPEGVAAGRTPPNWLKVGDVVECEISNIGVLRNMVAMTPERNVRPRLQ